MAFNKFWFAIVKAKVLIFRHLRYTCCLQHSIFHSNGIPIFWYWCYFHSKKKNCDWLTLYKQFHIASNFQIFNVFYWIEFPMHFLSDSFHTLCVLYVIHYFNHSFFLFIFHCTRITRLICSLCGLRFYSFQLKNVNRNAVSCSIRIWIAHKEP